MCILNVQAQMHKCTVGLRVVDNSRGKEINVQKCMGGEEGTVFRVNYSHSHHETNYKNPTYGMQEKFN